jgi:hypothetical protein
MKALCEILEIDYNEIKDKLPTSPKVDLDAASEKLANEAIDEEGGGADE